MLTDELQAESAAVFASMFSFRAGAYDLERELGDAGDFVAQYGTLHDAFPDPDVLAHYHGQVPDQDHRAGDFVAHWSAARGEPHDRPADAYETHLPDCQACTYLEGVHGIRELLIRDGCGTCGRDHQFHDFGPQYDFHGEAPNWVKVLDWFNPHFWCHEPWQRAEPKAGLFHDLFPHQAGDGYVAIWSAPLADGSYAAITRAFYFAEDGGDDDRRVMLEHAYLVCADPSKPWDTPTLEYNFSEEIDDEDDGAYDLKVMAEVCDDPARDEWATNMPDLPGFDWTRTVSDT